MKHVRMMCFDCKECTSVTKRDLIYVGFGHKRHLLEIKGKYWAFKCPYCGRQITVDKKRFR